jgi:glycosyltransferase involved in cell wall biosynthesis
MKVLHVIDCMKIGGAQRRLFQLLKGMQSSENTRNYLVLLSGEIHFPGLDKLNTEIIVIDSNRLISYGTFKKFKKVVKQIDPDVIHSWQLILSFYTTVLSVGFRFKHVNAMINDSSERGFFNKERLLAKAIIPFANVIVSNSYAGLRAYKVSRRNNVFVIHNGFDFARLNERAKASIDVFFKSAMKEEIIIGMIARFDHAKDYSTIIGAISSLLDTGKQVRFIAVGDGPTLDECKRMVPVKHKQRFCFAGKRSDIDAIVPLFDIGVLSTFTEGISNAIMEYMAFKKPVVATDCLGNREIVIDGHTGLLARSKDKQDWAEKLLSLIENQNIRVLYGRNGFYHLSEHFQLDTMISRYTDLYGQLLGQPTSPKRSSVILDVES